MPYINPMEMETKSSAVLLVGLDHLHKDPGV